MPANPSTPEVTRADEALTDAVAAALAKYAVAYTHVTLADFSTAGRSWKVHEVIDGNPFDRDEWLGEFDNKADAHAFCADLRRKAAVDAVARHRLAHSPARGGEVEKLREALEDVCNPLGYLQRRAEAEGARLSGMAYAIANDIGTVQKIARDALSASPPPVEGLTIYADKKRSILAAGTYHPGDEA